jgi:hypothetical protein
LAPRKLASTAARTRIVSRPSRNTSTALLTTAEVRLIWTPGSVGSGVPPPLCQARITVATATVRTTATQT